MRVPDAYDAFVLHASAGTVLRLIAGIVTLRHGEEEHLRSPCGLPHDTVSGRYCFFNCLGYSSGGLWHLERRCTQATIAGAFDILNNVQQLFVGRGYIMCQYTHAEQKCEGTREVVQITAASRRWLTRSRANRLSSTSPPSRFFSYASLNSAPKCHRESRRWAEQKPALSGAEARWFNTTRVRG